MNHLLNNLNDLKNKLTNNYQFFVQKTRLHYVIEHVKKFSMAYILIILFLSFGIKDPQLFRPDQIINLIQNNIYIWVLCLGMLLIIIAGHIDLSVGTLLGFLGIISVQLYNLVGNSAGSIILTTLIIILVGLILGLMQGFLVGYGKIPAFIVTLGGLMLFRGLQLWITNGQTFLIDGKYDSYYVQFVIGSIPDVKINNFSVFSFLFFVISVIVVILLRLWGRRNKTKFKLKTQNIILFIASQIITVLLFLGVGVVIALSSRGMQWFVFYSILIIVVFVFLTQNTTFGRSVYAIGGNKKAAALSGINIKRNTTIIFGIMGALAGFAAIIYTGYTTSAASNVGEEFALNIISAVFIGGASVSGGVGTVVGTILGAALLQTIDQAMTIANSTVAIKNVIKGLILIAAVGWDVFSNRKTR
ncbi:ABC transporter permease subunit [Mesomycoplasma neurolyticum]|uniref:Xylose transport system permease protein XylH n=1 Tax=Mesomycoplasma neurolyticum TaxID=2120 RepID=A0A449A6H4_9BACT|nr:sugar ABC transporter permease [Mesomycoplasma neurolyticum]VEU59836.1 Ribose ABC transporter [Mesomycoplasma neurolyticum]